MDKGPRIGDAVLGGRSSLLAQVKGSIGGGTVYLGTAGRCRYCSEADPARFRTVAHAFPEALGNKWVISRDECDRCNQIFSKYDDAIARAVSPFLTLGGVRGKSNKVRQTGRSEGDGVISRRDGADGQGLNMFATNADPAQHVSMTADGLLRMNMPVAGVPFRPRRAYKAVVKMGIALLPEEELDHYTKLRAWLLDADDKIDFPPSRCRHVIRFRWERAAHCGRNAASSNRPCRQCSPHTFHFQCGVSLPANRPYVRSPGRPSAACAYRLHQHRMV